MQLLWAIRVGFVTLFTCPLAPHEASSRTQSINR